MRLVLPLEFESRISCLGPRWSQRERQSWQGLINERLERGSLFSKPSIALRATNQVVKMNDNLLADPQIKKRWDAIVEPDWEENQRVFSRFCAGNGANRNVLNCAVPLARARQLTDFQMPAGWSLDKCLVTSGLGGFVPGLEDWRYTPHIRPEAQLPQMVELPKEHADLTRSPWFQSPSQLAGMGLNARHLRYHYQLWNDLKPRALRGLHTTLVLVSPQLGYSLTPHIQLQRALLVLFGVVPRVGAGSVVSGQVSLSRCLPGRTRKCPGPDICGHAPLHGRRRLPGG